MSNCGNKHLICKFSLTFIFFWITLCKVVWYVGKALTIHHKEFEFRENFKRRLKVKGRDESQTICSQNTSKRSTLRSVFYMTQFIKNFEIEKAVVSCFKVICLYWRTLTIQIQRSSLDFLNNTFKQGTLGF